MPSPNLRELDSRIRALEQMNLHQTKTDLVEQKGFMDRIDRDVKEVKDSIKYWGRLIIGTVLVSIIGAVLALLGLSGRLGVG